MSYAVISANGLAGPVDDLAETLYENFMSYARPAAKELTEQSIAQARGQIDSITDQVFTAAKPKIEAIAQEAITSGAIGTGMTAAKKEAAMLVIGTGIATVVLTYLAVKFL